MKLKLPKQLNQTGSLHLVVPLVLALVVIGAVFVRVSNIGHAAAGTTVKTATTTLPPPIKGVPYGTDSPLQASDIFPGKTANSPTVIFVHGGGWTTNDKSQFDTKALSLQEQGIAVFNINYRLDSSTVSAFPMEVDDVKAATQWAMAHAAQYNADPANVTLLGGSAGGQLVGMAAIQLNNAASGTVKRVVTLSGPTDFVVLVQDDINGSLGTTATDKNFEKDIPKALGCVLASCTTTTETQWSPARQITAANCPAGGWLLYNSQSELIPLDQPNAMIAALNNQGCIVKPTIIPGTIHAFGYWSTVRPAIVTFVKSP
jgi:acetyl esterase/lipase